MRYSASGAPITQETGMTPPTRYPMEGGIQSPTRTGVGGGSGALVPPMTNPYSGYGGVTAPAPAPIGVSQPPWNPMQPMRPMPPGQGTPGKTLPGQPMRPTPPGQPGMPPVSMQPPRPQRPFPQWPFPGQGQAPMQGSDGMWPGQGGMQAPGRANPQFGGNPYGGGMAGGRSNPQLMQMLQMLMGQRRQPMIPGAYGNRRAE
jgi:hypothetical protein